MNRQFALLTSVTLGATVLHMSPAAAAGPASREIQLYGGEIHERKTGQDFEYSTGCSYETFSNDRGWTPRKGNSRSRHRSNS